MKVCKDCKHFIPDTINWGAKEQQEYYATCALTALVTGLDGERCLVRRREFKLFFAYCGRDGKQWEAK